MAIGVYITFRILDVADLTVDGSIGHRRRGLRHADPRGHEPWLALLCAFAAGMLAGLVTGLFHTKCGIPAILAGILTQLALYSINLRIMGGKANQPIRRGQVPCWFPSAVRVALETTCRCCWSSPSCPDRAAVLVLRHGAGLLASALPAQTSTWPAPRASTPNVNIVLGLMLSNGLVALSGGAAGAVSGLCGHQHGPRRHRHRPGRRHHRRGPFGKIFRNFGSSCWPWHRRVIYYIVMQIVLQLG